MPAETILIVDDDPVCLTVATFALRTAGFTTASAADGMEALDLLQSLQPDLILCDIQMPHIDGFELARRTRQLRRFRDIPMIALTSFDSPDTERRAYAAGFTAYLRKPVRAAALAARVRSFLDSRIATYA